MPLQSQGMMPELALVLEEQKLSEYDKEGIGVCKSAEVVGKQRFATKTPELIGSRESRFPSRIQRKYRFPFNVEDIESFPVKRK